MFFLTSKTKQKSTVRIIENPYSWNPVKSNGKIIVDGTKAIVIIIIVEGSHCCVKVAIEKELHSRLQFCGITLLLMVIIIVEGRCCCVRINRKRIVEEKKSLV